MSAPEDEERLLPLAQRWPRASKFLLSGCAATVAELGTRPGPPARVSRGVAQGWGAGRAAAALSIHTCLRGQVWQAGGPGQPSEEEGWEITKVSSLQFRLHRVRF